MQRRIMRIAKSRNWNEEENFQEAVKFAHKIFIDPSRVLFPSLKKYKITPLDTR